MAGPNVSLSEGLNVETLSVWASSSTDVTEFVVANALVLIVAALLLLSCAKHALMCWEVRQDKRRLYCCHIRHCALLHAARANKQHTEADANAKAATEAETGTAAESVKDTPKGTAAASSAAAAAAPTTPAITSAWPAALPDAVAADTTTTPTSSSRRQARNANVSPVQHTAAATIKSHSRVSSLQLPLTSTSSSDFSFASSSSPKSVTTRLLNCLSISPGQMDVIPSAAAAEGSAKLPAAASAEFMARRNGCCPRYSEDEQRLIDEKRQANAQAWMEAKRALESTENLTSCMVSPAASTTRRTSTAGNETASREDLL